ncbi:MAG: hypothetical protein ABR562_01320 [Thermoplasmatota archaeon]
MAKDSSDDGYEFVPPDFDEDAFIHREMVEFKTTVIRTLWAVLAAAAAWAAFVLLKGDPKAAWPAGLAICLAFGLALKPLFQRFTDVTIYKRMDWVGTGLMFFLTWLALFVVAVNPPVTDISPPQVLVSADPPIQAEGGQVMVNFLASDNAGHPTYTLELTRDGVTVPAPVATKDAKHDHYGVLLASPTTTPGHYNAKVTATDGRGHTSSGQANFTIQPDFLSVRLPPGGNLTPAGEDVFVQVAAKPCTLSAPPCLRTVFFTSGPDGEPVPFEYDGTRDGWFAAAKFSHWKTGANTGHIEADFMDHYQGPARVEGIPGPEPLVSKESYTLNVQPPAERHDVEVLPTAAPQQVPIPAYGLFGVMASILGAAMVVRRRLQ